MLTDGFDTIEARPAFAYGLPGMYKATYKGKLVVAKALKTTASDDLENIRRVGGLILYTRSYPLLTLYTSVLRGRL